MGKPVDLYKGWWECTCGCHRTGAVHIINCCSKCRYCGHNISGDLEAHERERHAAEIKAAAEVKLEEAGWAFCTCECHQPGSASCLPDCCVVCPHCRKRIIGSLMSHFGQVHPDRIRSIS